MINETFLKYYANYQAGHDFPRGFSCETPENRENTVLYAWANGDSWLLCKPDTSVETTNVTGLDSLLAVNTTWSVDNRINLYIREPEVAAIDAALPDGYSARLLNEDDEAAFTAFHAACSEADKDEGQVALDDDLVYGVFHGADLVAVTSLWHWGDHIADVGVLTHPAHRRKGLMKVAVGGIATNSPRILFWRADVCNAGSNGTAKSCGFQAVGNVYSFTM